MITVGERGRISHYDGTTWSVKPSGTSRALYGIWGTNSQNVFAVGNGPILHFDGTSWVSMTDDSVNADGVWGTAPDNVYALGYNG